MNKKAFVLMETIVVILVISIALLTIFASYSKILTKVKTENKYDTSEYIYMTKYVRDYLKDTACTKVDDGTGNLIDVIYQMGTDATSSSSNNRKKELKNFKEESCDFSTNTFSIKGIYLLQYLNDTDITNEFDTNNKDLIKFNANMIDYIRKLDVGNNDIILVVEYSRPALRNDGELLKDYVNGGEKNQLYETYIASLEW